MEAYYVAGIDVHKAMLAVVVSEVMNGSMCRRRSSSASEVKVGSTAARYLPK